MKSILLAVFSLLFASQLFASNKLCVGEKYLVVLNTSTKKLTVHEKATLQIIQSTTLEGYSFGELALSSNEGNIWFEMDGIMYCRSVEMGEILSEIMGSNAYKFELDNSSQHLVHIEQSEEQTLVYIYDLNTREAVGSAKFGFKWSLETCHFDPATKELHLLSKKFDSTREKASEETVFGLPETPEEIEAAMRHDQQESHYLVYDFKTKNVVYDQDVFYSSDFETNFELIAGRLFVVTQLGTAEVLGDRSFSITPLVATNLSDYAIFGAQIVGGNGSFFFNYSISDGTFVEHWDDEVNQLLIDATAIAVTETEYYATSESVLYRFQRSSPREVDADVVIE